MLVLSYQRMVLASVASIKDWGLPYGGMGCGMQFILDSITM